MTKANDLLREIRRHNSSGLTKDMQSRIDAVLAQEIETPEQEGARLFREGRGLFNIPGDVSEANLPHVGRVIDAYAAAISQQAEPVEPTPAQDELIPRNRAIAEAFREGVEWQRNRPAQTEQQQSAAQQILDLIMEQCRYWHGRDEARRGGFACLYAEAKAVADSAPIAQTAPQPEQSELVEALIFAIQNIVHDDRVPNEVSQELAEVLILARRAALQENSHD